MDKTTNLQQQKFLYIFITKHYEKPNHISRGNRTRYFLSYSNIIRTMMTSYFQSSGHYENEWHEDIDTTECDWCGDIAPADEWFEEVGKDKHVCPSCKDNQEFIENI